MSKRSGIVDSGKRCENVYSVVAFADFTKKGKETFTWGIWEEWTDQAPGEQIIHFTFLNPEWVQIKRFVAGEIHRVSFNNAIMSRVANAITVVCADKTSKFWVKIKNDIFCESISSCLENMRQNDCVVGTICYTDPVELSYALMRNKTLPHNIVQFVMRNEYFKISFDRRDNMANETVGDSVTTFVCNEGKIKSVTCYLTVNNSYLPSTGCVGKSIV